MFVIGEAQIEEQIAHERFACDTVQCKGACCTLPGGRGAPLDDNEVAELERAYPHAKKYLPKQHADEIIEQGFYEGVPGSFATTCVDDRDCVFVYYEEGIARCSLERAYQNGETTWRKPLSCHLFPIRISKHSGAIVRYETIHECSPARTNGTEHNIPLYDYLRDPLVRTFGEHWYEEFRKECLRRDQAITIPQPAEQRVRQG